MESVPGQHRGSVPRLVASVGNRKTVFGSVALVDSELCSIAGAMVGEQEILVPFTQLPVATVLCRAQERALQNGLAQIYEKGLVEAVGVSNYGPKQLAVIHKRLSNRGVPLSSAQIQFSLLSYGPEQRDLKAMCDELGMTVIAYSPLALGLLTGMP